MRKLDDKRIVELYLSRDESAIRATSEKYGARLCALAEHITGDHGTAEECENDTYMEAWRAIPPHQPFDYLYAFLARMLRHIALNCCRNRSRLKRSAFLCELDAEMEQCIPAPDDVESRLDSIVLGEAINSFLRTLDAEKRMVFVRRYWYLDSITEIAGRFALSESKVKTMLFRSRRKLREYLEKEGYTL